MRRWVCAGVASPPTMLTSVAGSVPASTRDIDACCSGGTSRPESMRTALPQPRKPETWLYGFRGLVAPAALSLLATGCTPTAVKADLHAGGKVVVVNALESTVANQHMGITAFGNYNEALVNDWAIPQHAADSIVEALR